MKEIRLPHNEDAERALLGILILQPTFWRLADSLLSADDFYLESTRIIWRALSKIQPGIDHITLIEELRRSGEIEKCGGASGVASLPDGVPEGGEFVKRYAEMIRQFSARRHAAEFSTLFQTRALDGASIDDLSGELRRELKYLADFNIFGHMTRVSEGADVLMETIERSWQENRPLASGIASGFDGLDRLTGGFSPGDCVVLAARPSLGKSAFCAQIILNAALRGIPSGLLSLEMSRDSVMLRMACQLAEVSMHKLRNGKLDKYQRALFQDKFDVVTKLPIFISDEAGCTVQRAAALIDRAASIHDLKLVVVDYLQLLRTQAENRTQEVTKISGILQQLARDLGKEKGGALIAISQLNRAAGEGHPQLHHLRESGAIEQDADVVIFLSNDGDAEWGEPQRKRIEVAKQRNGPCGIFTMDFAPETMRFR